MLTYLLCKQKHIPNSDPKLGLCMRHDTESPSIKTCKTRYCSKTVDVASGLLWHDSSQRVLV